MPDISAEVSAKPDVAALIADFKRCSPWANNWNRVTTNEQTRLCLWPNQNADGKKHSTASNPAFPWDNASDCRVPLADAVCQELTAICCNAFWRSMVRPKAGLKEGHDYAVKLVDYYVNGKLYHHFTRHVELSQQYRGTHGWVALHPTWVREVAMELRPVRMQDLVNLAQAAAQNAPDSPLAQLPMLVQDPTLEDVAVEVIRQLHRIYAAQQLSVVKDYEPPELSASRARQAVRELRQDGECKIPVPYLCRNEPAIYARKPWDEIFIPNDLEDIQAIGERPVYLRQWMTEVALKTAVKQEGWNARWVEEAIKHKGKFSTWTSNTVNGQPPTNLANAMAGPETNWTTAETKQDLVEVLWAIYRQVDADDVPQLRYTVFHPEVCKDPDHDRELFAIDGIVEGTGGRVPFETIQSENIFPSITASRGVPEVVSTRQREVKVHRDSLTDLTSLTVLPPVNVYESAYGQGYKFGPAVQNTVTPGREPQFMQMKGPLGAPVAFDLMELIEKEVDNYYGLASETVLPVRQQVKQQMLVTPFLLGWSRAIQQMLALAQQFMPDAEFAEATGAPAGWLEQRRSQPGLLYAELQFDARELDPEFVAAQMKTMNEVVLPGDPNGVFDRAKWSKIQARMVNPFWARELILDDTSASKQLFNQVQQQVALMRLGNPPDMVEMDPTAPTKLKFLQQILQGNPDYQAELEKQGRFFELLTAYQQNLMFSVQQQQNKMIGRIGVNPEVKA